VATNPSTRTTANGGNILSPTLKPPVLCAVVVVKFPEEEWVPLVLVALGEVVVPLPEEEAPVEGEITPEVP